MKKVIVSLLIFLCLFCVPELRAQKMILSPESIDNGGLNYLKIIGQDDEGVFLLFSNLSLGIERDRVGLKTRRYKLAYFSFDLKPRWQQNVNVSDGADIETIGFFNNQVVVVSSSFDKSNDNLSFFIHYINAKGAVSPAKKFGGITADKSINPGKPRIRLSPNKSMVGVLLNEERENSQTVRTWICDTSLQLKKESAASLNYNSRDLDLMDAMISDDLQTSVLGQVRMKESASERKRTQLFRLFLINSNSKLYEYPVNTMNELMSEASLVFDRLHNTILVTGFYAEKGSFSGTGILYGRLPMQAPDSFKIATIPIRSDAQQKLIGERNNSNGVGVYNYPIQKVILRKDGGAVVVAEAAYLSEYSYYDYFTQTFNRRIEYHFDNVLILSVNANGAIDWSEVVRKEQASMDDEGYYSSFCAMYDRDRMALVYNDDISRNNQVVSYVIDNLGKIQVKKLSGISDNITLIPRSGKQVAESLIIVPATSRKRLYLARIDF